MHSAGYNILTSFSKLPWLLMIKGMFKMTEWIKRVPATFLIANITVNHPSFKRYFGTHTSVISVRAAHGDFMS